MQYRRLGRTNLDVSVIGIGTDQLRRVPERQAIDTLKRAFERGINLVNTGPDYEGADDIILKALQESELQRPVYLSFQAGGQIDEFERVFESTCEKFGTDCLDLFGISSISDQEVFGCNVWGTGGLVEFLLRKKEEKRIRGIFASDHGSPEQMKVLVERDVFDALMLAYNPLGFHLITFRAETVWQFETPPQPISDYHREDLKRTGEEIIPMAHARDVGIMLMKPLAGGLLCSPKAFPGHPWRDDLPKPPAAKDVLRYLLMNEAITCVVPGMASIDEVEENVEAGMGEITLSTAQITQVEARVAGLSRVLCSRCGECDDLCSKGLPISYLFRAAYHYLFPSAPFGISSTLQYFRLHPWEESACASCNNQTCGCPAGIDIPTEMQAIHQKMIELRNCGLVPAGDREETDWVSGQTYSYKVLSQEIPASIVLGEMGTVRLHLRNTGARPWYQYEKAETGQSAVTIAVYVDDQFIQTIPLRQTIYPRCDGHVAFALKAPTKLGIHELKIELIDSSYGSFVKDNAPVIRSTVWTLTSLHQSSTHSFIESSNFAEQRLIETLMRANAELNYQLQLQDHTRKQELHTLNHSLIRLDQRVKRVRQRNQELLQNNDVLQQKTEHLESEVLYLSTGKAAIRQILKKILHKVGLFDVLYRHARIVVPIYNLLLRDSWAPATLAQLPVVTNDRLSVDDVNQGLLEDLINKSLPTQDIDHLSSIELLSEPLVDSLINLSQSPPLPSSRPSSPPSSANQPLALLLAQTTPSSETQQGPRSVNYLEHNVPSECVAGARYTFRVRLENTGTEPWYRDATDKPSIGLGLFINNDLAVIGQLFPAVVKPGEQTTIPLTVRLPDRPGGYHFRFDLLMDQKQPFSGLGAVPMEVLVQLKHAEKTPTDALLDISCQRNYWYFSPGQSVYRSQGQPTYPVFAESTRGCILTDVDGRQFVDVHMGWGCCLLGYTEDRIQAAITRSMTSSGVISLPHRLEIQVAEALCTQYPWGDEVLFGKNGSDVTTWAIRAARIITGKKTIVFAGYHGWQDWNVGCQGFAATGVPSDNNRYAISLPYRNIEALEAAVAAYAGDLAAIMIEPAATTVDIHDPYHLEDGAYLQRAEALARQHGALLIFDEIMTGFRFRAKSAQAFYGVSPDLTCLGKAIANGMPLSALVGRRELLKRTIGQIFYAPTMKGEVYSFAAALEALQIYQEEDIPAAVWAIGDQIRERVNQVAHDLDLNVGLIGPPYRMHFGFFDIAQDEDEIYYRTLLQQELTRHGIISHRGVVIPSRRHNQDAIDRVVLAFTAALQTLRGAIASGTSIHYLDIPNLPVEKRELSRLPANSAQQPTTPSTDQSLVESPENNSTDLDAPSPSATEASATILPVADRSTLLQQEIRAKRVRLQSAPETINIEFTGACNIKPACTFCVGKNAKDYQEPGHMHSDQLDQYWPYLLRSQRVNDCSYGEPLLYPRIEEVIQRIASTGGIFGFTTNGLLLNEKRSQLLLRYANSVRFIVSLNAATPETYFRLHGKDFDTVIRNVEQFILLYQQKYPYQALPCVLSFIVMRANQHEVLDFLRLATKLGVQNVILRHLFDLRVGDYEVNNFDYQFVYENERLLYDDYRAIEARVQASPEFVHLKIDYQWNSEKSFITEQKEADTSHIPCLFPWKFLCIRPLHNTYTPCVFLKKSIASPSTTNLEDVWNGDTIVEMRKSLIAGEVPGFCKAYGDYCPIVIERTRQIPNGAGSLPQNP